MGDREEQQAQEHLRQAQEERREADEGVRQAQEGVRDTRERVGDESRQSGEAGRVHRETGRETAEEGRVVAEEGRETERTGAKSERARLKAEFYVIYGVLILLGAINAWVMVNLIEDMRQADRAGCERQNDLRKNQSRILKREIGEKEQTLDTLNGLERFRPQIEKGLRGARRDLARLRKLGPDIAESRDPYKVDCPRAYP